MNKAATMAFVLTTLAAVSTARSSVSAAQRPKIRRQLEYVFEPSYSCQEETLGSLVFLVRTSPDHFQQRQLIRETWASRSQIGDRRVKVFFVMGSPEAPMGLLDKLSDRNRIIINYAINRAQRSIKMDGLNHLNGSNNRKSQTGRLLQEQMKYGDIIRGSFVDNGSNETLKHMLGFQFINDHCSTKEGTRPVFIVQTEDDVFVEIFHLVDFISAIYGKSPSRSLICEVVPRGPAMHVEGHVEMRPEYCTSTAYLVTPDLATEFLHAYQETSSKIADGSLHVTGFLREVLDVKPFYLNLRYTSDSNAYLKWLTPKRKTCTRLSPLPYLFVKNGTGNDWFTVCRRLWRKTVSIHSMGNIDS